MQRLRDVDNGRSRAFVAPRVAGIAPSRASNVASRSCASAARHRGQARQSIRRVARAVAGGARESKKRSRVGSSFTGIVAGRTATAWTRSQARGRHSLAFEAAAQRSRSGAAIASLIALPLALRVCTSGRPTEARTHQRLLLEQDRDGHSVLGQRAPGDVDQLLLRSRLAVLEHDDGTARSVRRARRHEPDALAHRSIRQRDSHAVVHSGVRVERVLDLAAGHVLALDDDDLEHQRGRQRLARTSFARDLR